MNWLKRFIKSQIKMRFILALVFLFLLLLLKVYFMIGGN
jgi:hypothetical protein